MSAQVRFVCKACLLFFVASSWLPGLRLMGQELKLEEAEFDTQALTLPFTKPSEALEMLQLPEGFRATLFAAEPDVIQPIAACTDSRGRLWVVENLTYSDGSTNYDLRLKDRVIILEDKDNDGQFDQRTVFWDQGQKITGIEVGFGGVWLTAAPNLLFVPDRDHDDKPDGEPIVLLDGFEGDVIRHNIVNGLRWGPDGWLYGRHGIQATSQVGPQGTDIDNRVAMNCAIWRIHPVSKQFEIVAQGGTNPWGFDYDQHGEMFMINTVIGHLFHVVPGARYRRMYGQHFNPHTYQVIEQTADHFHWAHGEEHWQAGRGETLSKGTDEAGGGHAHTGLMIYQGQNWPEKYHNTLFTANFHGRRLNNDTFHRDGNSYVGRHANDFMKTADPWFRGVEMIYGPDGGVFVLDWSDIGECHENDGIHRSSGRIFKVVYGDVLQSKGLKDLRKCTDAELVQQLLHPNEWFSRKARRLLQERAVANRLKSKSGTVGQLRAVANDQSLGERATLRAMWALGSMGFASLDDTANWLKHSSEHVKSWSVRLAGEVSGGFGSGSEQMAEAALAQLVEAATDSSALVRLYAASRLKDLDGENCLKVATLLARQPSDANDRVQPHLVWYGIEPHVTRDPRWIEFAVTTSFPLLRENIARRVMNNIESQPERVVTLVDAIGKLSSERKGERARQMLAGMKRATEGWSSAEAPKNWQPVSETILSLGDPQTAALVQSLGVVFGDGRSIAEIEALVFDENADAPARRKAIETWSATQPDELFTKLKRLLRNKSLSNSVAKAMVHCREPRVATELLNWFRNMGPEGQGTAIDTLVKREVWALELLKAVERGQVSRQMLSAYHASAMGLFQSNEIDELLAKVWGVVKATPAEKQERIKLLTSELENAFQTKLDGDKLKGMQSQGRTIFADRCSACHKLYGVGGTTGPDLTGSDRKNLNYLLSNMIAPSSSVAEAYRSMVLQMEDGRLISGLVIEENERSLKIQLANEVASVDVSEIESRRRSDTSVMPDGLLNNLSARQIEALVRYLRSDQQVPLSNGEDAGR